MKSCTTCGSQRLLEGPAHSPEEYTCMDCGSQYNRVERVMPKPEEVSSNLAESIPVPTGGFATMAEAQAHLEKLKQKSAEISGTSIKRPKKVTPPPTITKLVDDFPPEFVYMGIHCYQREDEAWQQVLNTAKGEREYKNDNVRIWAHNHNFGKECTHLCREVPKSADT